MIDLFYCRCEDESGQNFNQDLLVYATSHDEAVDHWTLHFEEPEGFSQHMWCAVVPAMGLLGPVTWEDIHKTQIDYRFDDNAAKWVRA